MIYIIIYISEGGKFNFSNKLKKETQNINIYLL